MTASHGDQPTGDEAMEAGEQLLDDVWDASAEVALDADCSPTKVCRNARDFTFDGIAEGAEDLPTAWRKLLEQEGKLATGGSSVRDLVFGSSGD